MYLHWILNIPKYLTILNNELTLFFTLESIAQLPNYPSVKITKIGYVVFRSTYEYVLLKTLVIFTLG